jgi:DNA-binding NtrC family response regulator
MPKRKLRLLVVDDEKDVCEFIRYIFRQKGFITYSASSGRKAVEVAKKAKPDIALIDLYLGRGMNGLKVMAELKKIVPSCLSVMITWDTSKAEAKGAEKLGVACYLAKPFTVKELEGTVQKLAKKIRKEGKNRG